jgi:hypothetical protein
LISGDGLIINVLAVLQKLAAPINIDKIDLNAIFYSSDLSPLLLKDDESRINFTREIFLEWKNNLSKFQTL